MHDFKKNILIDFHGRIAQKSRIEKYIKNVIHHYCPRMRRVVNVDIYIHNRLDNECYGFCSGNKNHIDIELARGSGDETFDLDYIMLNLAHELIHAKQFLLGQLSPTNFQWKTKDYNGVPYSRTPWEREAYRKEDWVYETFWVSGT